VMMYLALISGARGIFWYNMTDAGWNLARTRLWKRFAALNSETATLADILARGTLLEDVKCSDDSLKFRAVTSHDNKVYILAANPSPKPLRAWLRLPLAITDARLLASGKELTPRGRTLKVELGPWGAVTIVADIMPHSAQ